MSRRRAVILVLSIFTICAALLVSSTGKPGSPIGIKPPSSMTSTSQKPKVMKGDFPEHRTLSIAVSMDEAEFQYWLQSNARFQHAHPRITINMTNIAGEDEEEARKEAFEAGQPFDVMLLDNDRVREFAMQGELLPVDEIVTGDSAADLLEALTGMVKWNGSLWGVPVDSNPLLSVWSKKLLKAAGADAPPKDMEAFKLIASSLSVLKPGSVSIFNLNTANASDMSAWLGLFPGDATTAAELSPFSNQQKQQLRFAAEHVKELLRLNPLQQRAELVEAFRTDSLLNAVIPWSLYFGMKDADRSLLTMGSATGPVVRSNGRSFVLTSDRAKLDEAREWIQEMTSTEALLARYRSFGRLPARISVMTGELGYNEIGDRPPYFLARLLQQGAAAPDPSWRQRWVRWNALCAALGGNGVQFMPEAVNQYIARWNGEHEPAQKNSADAPSVAESQADG